MISDDEKRRMLRSLLQRFQQQNPKLTDDQAIAVLVRLQTSALVEDLAQAMRVVNPTLFRGDAQAAFDILARELLEKYMTQQFQQALAEGES